MAFFDASKSRFSMTDSGGDLRDISPNVISVSGLPGERTLVPATTINDTGRKSHPGIEVANPRLELLYDDTADTGSETVFAGLFKDETPRGFKFGPEGSASGDVAVTGTALVRVLEFGTRVGNLQSIIVDLEVQGVVAITTWGA